MASKVTLCTALLNFSVVFTLEVPDKFCEELIYQRRAHLIQEELLTTAEACAALRISYATLLRRMKDGTIRSFKMGRRNRIPRSEVAKALEPREIERPKEGAA